LLRRDWGSSWVPQPVLVLQGNVDTGDADGDGNCDASGVKGIRRELVVRPFGRRGDNFSIRDVGVLASLFQLGMQPTEVVGEDVDTDGDGVANEFSVGEISAMTLWQGGLEPLRQTRLSRSARAGREAFDSLGCADCHIPELHTRSRQVTFSFPEVPEDPTANVFQRIDLRSVGFARSSQTKGVRVAAFTDLKLHDMGPGLTDQPAGSPGASQFVTIALWGVADSAPYLHDGRALTINDAILQHDGEGKPARDAYAAAPVNQRRSVIAFLSSLRAPKDPDGALLRLSPATCR